MSRARTRWSKIQGLEPLAKFGLHEARHTFASLMIAAGVNAKALCEYMGHSSITVTFDRYGHLMPGSHEEAAALLDAYLGQRGEM
jgi:integrase